MENQASSTSFQYRNEEIFGLSRLGPLLHALLTFLVSSDCKLLRKVKVAVREILSSGRGVGGK